MKDVGQHLLSGAVSGLSSTVGLQPFDLLKTRLQQRDGTLDIRKSPSVFTLTKTIITTEGLTGLWRGTTASLFRNVPGIALYMTGLAELRGFIAASPVFSALHAPAVNNLNAGGVSTYTSTKGGGKVVRQGSASGSGSVLPKLSSQGNLLAGTLMRVSVGFVLNPFTVLKARYESNIYAYTSFPRAFLSVVRGGPQVMLKGFIPGAISSGPYAGIFIASYEGIKKWSASLLPHSHLSTHPPSPLTSTAIHTLSAATAGALATLTTHPFDLLKTKIQVRPEHRYASLPSAIRTVFAQRGVRGFFDGMSLRISRKVVSSAVGWAVYEGLLMGWERRKERGRTSAPRGAV